jgi:hypothetical protein
MCAGALMHKKPCSTTNHSCLRANANLMTSHETQHIALHSPIAQDTLVTINEADSADHGRCVGIPEAAAAIHYQP